MMGAAKEMIDMLYELVVPLNWKGCPWLGGQEDSAPKLQSKNKYLIRFSFALWPELFEAFRVRRSQG